MIHEARFTYQNYGLHKLADMGEHWESTTGLPIPLGAIIAKRSLGPERLRLLAESIRTSVRAAWDDPEVSRPYVMEHAQEMDPAVADQHIGLYVNEFTADLGEDGYAAVRGLLTRAAAEGLVPALRAPKPFPSPEPQAAGRSPARRPRPAKRRKDARKRCRGRARTAHARGGRGARAAPRSGLARLPVGARTSERTQTSNWSATARSRPAIFLPEALSG
ncbi:1,4-dihydroxy-6-naphtoate synthase [Streptomyces tendae]